MRLSDKILTDEDIQKIVDILNPEENEYGVTYKIHPENNLKKCSIFVPSLIETIRDRDKTIKELSSIYELQFGALNQQLREQLAKYERVVEAARHLITKARDNKTITGDNGQPDWYEYSAQDFDALMDAVDSLKA